MEQSRRVYEITELLHNMKNASESVNQILEKMMQTVDAEAASLWFLNRSTQTIGIYAARGEKSHRLSEIVLQLGEGICGQCIKTGKSIFVKNAQEDERWFRGADSVTGFKTLSMISIPLSTESEGTYGCVQLLNKRKESFFNQDDCEFAELVGSMFAISLVKNHIFVSENEHRDNILRIENLTKIYGEGASKTKALDNVSISIRRGELLVILGTSGSGKSTLLNIIGGMTKASSGKMILTSIDKTLTASSEKDTFVEEDVCKYNKSELTAYRKNKIGFIFQFYNLIPDLTAYENVALTAELVRSKVSVTEMLSLVGVRDKRKKYPSQMSGGEQQRVSIARALVKNTELLLCDEPTGALDFNTGRQVLILLEELARKHHKTVIIVTHSMPIAAIADRVIRMSGGKIEEEILNPSPIPADTVEW